MRQGEVDIISLGCSKNLVDSEAVARRLYERGYTCVLDPETPQGEYVVVNTCGFIEDAKQESIDTILRLAQMKQRRQIGSLLVMGCLSQRYLSELEEAIPEVDRYYGKFNFLSLVDDLPVRNTTNNTITPTSLRFTPAHYAYVKISEGCDRHCAFCAIPLMTGRHVSRPMDEIVAYVAQLAAEGVKEINVIAQELTYYGVDLYGKRMIAPLIECLSEVPGIAWIRLHYAYPHDFPLELLDVMRERDNVCKYLDIAFQHSSDSLLTAMRRHVTRAQTMELIQTIRSRVPGIHLRTTLMVGFPGETDDDFADLLAFVQEVRFERMGAFMYSEEEGTYAASHLSDTVPAEVKQQRLDTLMALQQTISTELTAQHIGRTLTTIIDRQEGDYYIGRTQYSSPEVDPEVLIPATTPLTIGAFYPVTITDSDEFDLYGEIAK